MSGDDAAGAEGAYRTVVAFFYGRPGVAFTGMTPYANKGVVRPVKRQR
ncbi:MAG: hypothetical protein LBC62_07550 [Treponema sp.]|nr:hypothetical protein [Treponema sp.]